MSPRSALLQLHFGALLLGGSALLPRFIHLPVTQLVLWRSLIAAALLLGLAALLREPLRTKSSRESGWLLLCSLLLGLHWLTYFRTIQISTVAFASVCFYTFPVMTVFLEPLFGRTRLHRSDVIAAVAVLMGVGVIAQPGAGVTAESLSLGLLCAALMAVRNVLYRHRLGNAPPVAMTGWQFLIVGLALLPSVDSHASASASDWWAAMLVFGVLFTAAPHVLFVSALRTLPAKTLGVVTSLMPLYAALFAWLLFGESPSWTLALGGALIVGAALFESFREA